MRWYKIPELKPTQQAFIKKVKIGGKSICVVGAEGDIFAVSARCPHAGGDLSLGWCKNQKLICPLHRYSYDLHTGKGSTGQNDFIYTFPVKIQDDAIYIGINTFWEKLKQLLK
ncbi:3-phenylpropionate/trans-cinnamate dioxygenase ferredoxin subunit [Mucilaginibacter frigoritolerans]|jgi:nitrite reductase/ring-hydroxylating ferredoxin subunit|uniref:3-phenylpropionate/trans-cinnamate dioxygenase ferredoxin subunit n=1 Tax=Mucilaginibacter frigoritolerans TaxID=652788 RepID=A0A562UI04_9SPHI|nr:Rieske 2Fe-2S domain-containing protein [Mucilaginibacter frigoritolerans]TWJ04915.1 3-phenylpropionate/trans-cinnamate dioxygenase ferredoxin subunit [Mucilaginibacter frigoritolerans]